MFKIWIIAQRELQSFFDSLMAYILLVLFLGFSGLFTWLYGADVFISGQASLRSFFSIAYWTLFFFIPALTMKSLAEERKTGTIELLLTKAVTDRQVILGKFLSIVMLIAIALVFTLPYYLTVASIGPIDHGATLLGYVGLLLMSATYISLGIYTSSLTNNQIVAFLLSIFIGLLFHLVFDVLAANFTGIVGELLAKLSLSTHFESISRGVMDSKDLVYFISFITLCLFLAEISLAKRNVIK
jgi:ABC-2 type transport system permease protein